MGFLMMRLSWIFHKKMADTNFLRTWGLVVMDRNFEKSEMPSTVTCIYDDLCMKGITSYL